MPHGKNGLLEIQHKLFNNPLKLCSFWLRDHCPCINCYGETFQRKFNLKDIPLDIEPKQWNIDNDYLSITCEYLFSRDFESRNRKNGFIFHFIFVDNIHYVCHSICLTLVFNRYFVLDLKPH